MGKGGGQCFSATESTPTQQAPKAEPVPPVTASAPRPAATTPAQTPERTPSTMAGNKKIAIIFYSTYGHIYQLAQKVKEGVDSIDGVEGVLYQVPETLSEDVLKAIHAPPKPDVPIITASELPDFDGFIFGIPTRFGMAAAQVKSFLDSTGGLWVKGALVGKPAGIFVSSGTQGGGIETTALTFVTQLAHHGMIFVPTGYSFGERMFNMDEVHAGTPYGASTYAGPTGARQPSEYELDYAKYQGSYVAGVAKKLAA